MKRKTVGGIISMIVTCVIILLLNDEYSNLISTAAIAANIPLAIIFSKKDAQNAKLKTFLQYSCVTIITLGIVILIVFVVTPYRKIGG